MEQKLEQMLKLEPKVEQKSVNKATSIYTSGLTTLCNGFDMDACIRRTERQLRPSYTDINPRLSGGCYLDLEKNSRNTFIIGEDIPGMRGARLNTYIHHDRGPGRMTSEF